MEFFNLFGMVTTKSHTEPTLLCVCKEKLDGIITSKKRRNTCDTNYEDKKNLLLFLVGELNWISV